MNIREVYSQARQAIAALSHRPIGKDSGLGLCRLENVWALPITFPWYEAGLCREHDRLQEEAKMPLRDLQWWWIRAAWKASPTWQLKLFYALTLPAVLGRVAWAYKGPR